MKRKILIYSILIMAGIIVVLIVAAPVNLSKSGQLQIADSVEIAKGTKEVFVYMGNSKKASEWSTYVDHISLLSGKDGNVGCKRRCFQEANETGIRWDETILKVDTFNLRRLSIYNAVDFPMYVEGLTTEQQYIAVKKGASLSLVLMLPKGASILDKFKFYLASYKVKSVFKGNLLNIRNDIEGR